MKIIYLPGHIFRRFKTVDFRRYNCSSIYLQLILFSLLYFSSINIRDENRSKRLKQKIRRKVWRISVRAGILFLVSLFNRKSETSLERIKIVARGHFRRARDAWVHARSWHNLQLVVSNRWFRTLMPAIIDHEWPIVIKPFRYIYYPTENYSLLIPS